MEVQRAVDQVPIATEESIQPDLTLADEMIAVDNVIYWVHAPSIETGLGLITC